MALLTKSKYMNGLQCTRLLWFANKKQLPQVSLADQHKFDQGHEFEEYVKKLYPEAVDLNGLEFKDNLNRTKELIQNRSGIFEAGFMLNNLFVRSDLILPTDNGWNLYEIKSTSEAKPQHIPDLAFQKYVLEQSGLKINKSFVIFLNKEFTKHGEINPNELIQSEEVTDQVNEIKDIEENVQKFMEVMNLPEYLDIPIGKHCNSPYECPLKKICWATLPENNVLHLTNWRLYWKLFNEGIKDIKDIPENTKLTDKDQIIVDAANTQKTIIDKAEINKFISKLTYPLYHFDFETFDTAVPIFDNSKPYQKIPFQYSLHVEQADGSTEHKEFLYDGSEDPRPALLEQLKQDLAGTGDIVTFNKSFEIGVLNKLAEDFPEHIEWLQDAIGRIVDLADPFKQFYYYDPSQKGSYSIKKVLPAITGRSYSELEITNGGDASMLYFYSHIRPKLENKEEIRRNLLKYCELDTEGMVLIVKNLKDKF